MTECAFQCWIQVHDIGSDHRCGNPHNDQIIPQFFVFEHRFEIPYQKQVKHLSLIHIFYDNYGFLTGFALNFGTVDTLMPQDYSEEVMAEMFAPFVPTGEEDTSDFENPDVIVVLSEAFWDPTKLEGVTFSDDPLKNYRAIAAEHPSGEMVSCTFGGGTIRPEFEIQSGMSTSTLPSGNMPYQQYLKEKTFAYAQLFKSLGYDTLGVHTYQKTFYERDRAYPLMLSLIHI